MNELKKYNSFEEMKSDYIKEDISDEEINKRHKELEEFINEIKKSDISDKRPRAIQKGF